MGPQLVTITESLAGPAIHYTTDGSTPTRRSAMYVDQITVSTSETIKAIAVGGQYLDSDVATASFTINPTAALADQSPEPGVVRLSKKVHRYLPKIETQNNLGLMAVILHAFIFVFVLCCEWHTATICLNPHLQSETADLVSLICSGQASHQHGDTPTGDLFSVVFNLSPLWLLALLAVEQRTVTRLTRKPANEAAREDRATGVFDLVSKHVARCWLIAGLFAFCIYVRNDYDELVKQDEIGDALLQYMFVAGVALVLTTARFMFLIRCRPRETTDSGANLSNAAYYAYDPVGHGDDIKIPSNAIGVRKLRPGRKLQHGAYLDHKLYLDGVVAAGNRIRGSIYALAILCVLLLMASVNAMGLSWNRERVACVETAYNWVELANNAVNGQGTPTSVTSYTDTGLTNGPTSWYAVAAVNGDGTSPLSSKVKPLQYCFQPLLLLLEPIG
jgi:hypothetical protein